MHAGPVSNDATRRLLCGAFALAGALLLAAPAFAQRGALTVPRNLIEMSERAADIVRGTVVSARVEKHPELTNLDTVVVTLRVREALKGGAQGSFTFRQYIWDIRDRWDAAGYRKGFLALNGTGNAHLFDGIAAAAARKGVALTEKQSALAAKHRGGPVGLAELMAMFRTLARAD
jgi:hypothetical protein